ncbi:MAG: hypothetical protein RBG13Loki_1065 [Promethearchaeota archaeon CR_4]|nr:MAG: hypothetical protein RBG13Loki_1065 [Candidatus Lokiarchaeota archaeon CR_4]
MLWIDWLHVDWFVVSGGILAILVIFYVGIKLKNFFFRWSISQADFLQPFEIHTEITSQKDMKQTVIRIKEETKKLDPVVIWVVGKCPRFLFNIACSLSLHVTKVCVNEMNAHPSSINQIETNTDYAYQIFYGKAVHLAVNFKNQLKEKITILIAPQGLKELKEQAGIKIYLILGKSTKPIDLQVLEREGLSIINLHGGNHFRGWELALLGELVVILKNDSRIPR